MYNKRCYDKNMNMGMNPCCIPVYECPIERVCNKDYVYEVKHICPINTRVINHHIYKHTYVPYYTTCEEDECSNIYENQMPRC